MSYPSIVLADTPVAYYQLGERTGTTAVDSSGNGLDGTYTSPSLGAANLIISSNASTYLGGSARLSLGNPAALQIIGTISLECWFSLGTLPTSGNAFALLSKGYDGSTQGWVLQLGNDAGTLNFFFGSFDGVDNHGVQVNVSMIAGPIHHIVGTSDGSHSRLYLDGTLIATAADTVGALATTSNARIGSFEFTGAPQRITDGLIDEAAIYNYALTQGQISAHYAAGRTATTLQTAFLGKQFGALVHWGMTTFTGDYIIHPVDSFAPTGYNPGQWNAAVKAARGQYVLLTTKGTAGFALWPSTATAYNVAATAWYGSTGIDPVGAFVSDAKSRGLKVGLYIAMDDVHYQTVANPGYTNQQFTDYTIAIITELTAYAPDYIWCDGWNYVIPFTTIIYDQVYSALKALLPNCLLIVNSHQGNLLNSDIVELEHDVNDEPAAGNIFPSEFVAPSRLDGNFYWTETGQDDYLDPSTVYDTITRLNARACNYDLAASPNTTGVLPTAEVTFLQAVGALFPSTSLIIAGKTSRVYGGSNYGPRCGSQTYGNMTPAPVNTVLPVIDNTSPREGDTLNTTNGTWTGSPTFTYQWKRTGNPIGGATNSSYTATFTDAGEFLSVTVTATNGGGSTPATSLETSPVLPLAPVNTVPPVLSGNVASPSVSDVLSVSDGTWDHSPNSFTYLWHHGDGSPATGTGTATPSYTVGVGDLGSTLQCTVTAINNGGSAPADSDISGTVT